MSRRGKIEPIDLTVGGKAGRIDSVGFPLETIRELIGNAPAMVGKELSLRSVGGDDGVAPLAVRAGVDEKIRAIVPIEKTLQGMVGLPGIHRDPSDRFLSNREMDRVVEEEMGGVPVFSSRAVGENQSGFGKRIAQHRPQLIRQGNPIHWRCVNPILLRLGVAMVQELEGANPQGSNRLPKLSLSNSSEGCDGIRGVGDTAFSPGQAYEIHRDVMIDQGADQTRTKDLVVGVREDHGSASGIPDGREQILEGSGSGFPLPKPKGPRESRPILSVEDGVSNSLAEPFPHDGERGWMREPG